uniref:Uncharacterized protein n=1 Tax=Anguilla anguilla TaxID=7936 RepID=A0A0E9TX54_ANGAN
MIPHGNACNSVTEAWPLVKRSEANKIPVALLWCRPIHAAFRKELVSTAAFQIPL